MRTTLRLVGTTLALCLTAISSNAMPKNSKDIVEEQTRYCQSVWEYTQTNLPQRFFAEVENSSDGRNHAIEWREFATKEELEKDENHVNAAFVWLRDGKLVAANFTLGSGSGDWVQYGDYCFDRRGRLAGIQEELRTFYGMIDVKRTYIYDARGRLLSKSEQFTDLDSQNPKKTDEEFIDENLPIYLRSQQLPYAFLIKKGNR